MRWWNTGSEDPTYTRPDAIRYRDFSFYAWIDISTAQRLGYLDPRQELGGSPP